MERESAVCVTIFMCGDLMTGRGIDQVLPHPGAPRIYEPCMESAEGYVALAERKNGPVPKPVDFSYIWGDALDKLERVAPDARIINLETAVTKSADYEDKGINYRMHPDNIPCITAARIDCCSLANNHVLDWGRTGLFETLDTLERAGLGSSGAGRNLREAETPAVVECGVRGRVLVFSFGSGTSGIPASWAAMQNRPGVNLLKDFSAETVSSVRQQIEKIRRPGDVVIASVHWGGNWGYDIPEQQREFAHAVIDKAGVDVVHGHSSHHVKGIEVYGEKLICYGCGDFINDYEGIGGFETYRADLGLMYFVTVETVAGRLVSLEMVPTRINRFRVNQASAAEAAWLSEVLNREGKRLGTWTDLGSDDVLTLRWEGRRYEVDDNQKQ